jgi:RimJ/RimL family protein N-acetyltransferase
LRSLANAEPVGRTDLFDVDPHHGSAEFGITIGDPAGWPCPAPQAGSS